MQSNIQAAVGGSCLCGAVKFEIAGEFLQFHLCHCRQCQKSSGSAHAANLFVAQEHFSWLSGEHRVKRYDVPGRNISSVFCGACGCPVPYLSKTGKAMVVPAGALDDMPAMLPQSNIFWAERAIWYADGLRCRKYAYFPESD